MRFIFVLGTRPEAIKLAPVILAARAQGHEAVTVFTGQHREMALPLLSFFGIRPEVDLEAMTANQTLTTLSARILEKLDVYRETLVGDVIIVQGDTTSAAVAAYWAFCRKIPVAHVEAGLRTFDLASPFPEEANRQIIGRLAAFHFTPTAAARKNLKKENIQDRKIFTVGNTSIDTLQLTLRCLKGAPSSLGGLAVWIGQRKLVLVTAHRRESFGEEFENICQGILRIADSRPDACVIYPVHLNPNVREPVYRILGNHARIRLIEPLSYVPFVELMQKASLLLTDSGGIQEEGPSLKKPILVMRKTTERPEGVAKGFAKLVGTNADKIFRESIRALSSGLKARGPNPYGDGKSAERIVRILSRKLKPRKS